MSRNKKPRILDYRRPDEAPAAQQRFLMDLSDPAHDFYAPLIVLVLGLVAGALWIVIEHDWQFRRLVINSLGIVGFECIKVGVLIALVLVRARTWEFSFGTLRATILKITAAVIFIDAGRAWLHVGMTATGMISASGKGPAGAFWLDVMAMLFIAILLARFVFGMDDENGGALVAVTGMLNWVLDLLLKLLLIAGVYVAAAAHHLRPAQTPANSQSSQQAAPATRISVSQGDTEIRRRIKSDGPLVLSGREWQQNCDLTRSSDAMIAKLISQLYAAGAAAVYVDNGRDLVHQEGEPRESDIFVNLPTGDPARSDCIKLCREYRPGYGPPVVVIGDPAHDNFLDLQLRPASSTP